MRDAALLWLAYETMGQRSEPANSSALQVEQLAREADGSIRLLIECAKADQDAAGTPSTCVPETRSWISAGSPSPTMRVGRCLGRFRTSRVGAALWRDDQARTRRHGTAVIRPPFGSDFGTPATVPAPRRSQFRDGTEWACLGRNVGLDLLMKCGLELATRQALPLVISTAPLSSAAARSK